MIGMVSVTLSLLSMLYTGVTAYALNHHISYQPLTPNHFIENWYVQTGETIIYALATIAPFFISTLPLAWIAGIAIAAGFIVAHIFYYCAFASVWCFFAALASGAVYCVVDRHNRRNTRNRN
jgi:hypothetical protein